MKSPKFHNYYTTVCEANQVTKNKLQQSLVL